MMLLPCLKISISEVSMNATFFSIDRIFIVEQLVLNICTSTTVSSVIGFENVSKIHRVPSCQMTKFIVQWNGSFEQLSTKKYHTRNQNCFLHSFEKFLGTKWTTEKRFGVEGCDMLIPTMKMVIDTVIQNGVDTLIMGMPHRWERDSCSLFGQKLLSFSGRLNVLANVIQKPLEEILCQFNENLKPSDTSVSTN